MSNSEAIPTMPNAEALQELYRQAELAAAMVSSGPMPIAEKHKIFKETLISYIDKNFPPYGPACQQ